MPVDEYKKEQEKNSRKPQMGSLQEAIKQSGGRQNSANIKCMEPSHPSSSHASFHLEPGPTVSSKRPKPSAASSARHKRQMVNWFLSSPSYLPHHLLLLSLSNVVVGSANVPRDVHAS